jgi:HEAT repeat protein
MSSADQDPAGAQLSEDLPPVQPPSAGFIIQLFVVPGLIVMAIVGVWLLFGKLATGEQDWKSLVVELQHPNPHRRWRAATGLAQMVKADQQLGAAGQLLSQNREIAQALAEVLVAEVKRGGQSDDDVKYETFLATSLGAFDLPDIVVPPLEQAMQPGIDRDVRKYAIWAIAVIADRHAGGAEPLRFPGLIEELTKVSRDEDPLIRQIGAFTLGLFPDDGAKSRLEVMTADPDSGTRINAAIALARHGDVHGAAVFEEVLKSAAESNAAGSDREFEQFLALKNCLVAVQRVAGALSADEREKLAALIAPIAADFREPGIRIAAKTALTALQEAR